MNYLKNRLCEKSTWAGIATAVAGGGVASYPYNVIAIAVGLVAALMPTGGGK